MKKLLMTIGTISAVVTPVVAVVSCGNNKKDQKDQDAEIKKEVQQVVETVEQKAGKTLNALGITDIDAWVSQIMHSFSSSTIKPIDPTMVEIAAENDNNGRFYFRSNSAHEQSISGFNLQPDLSWSATINIIDTPFSENGFEVQGSLRTVYINVSKSGHINSYNEETHSIRASNPAPKDSFMVISKNGIKVVSATDNGYWSNLIHEKFDSEIKDPSVTAQELHDMFEAYLNNIGLTMVEPTTNKDYFKFNSSTRTIQSLGTYIKH